MAKATAVSPGPIRVMLVDDHPATRAAIHALLNRREGIEVVGEAATARSAIRIAAAEQPDVILLAVRLPDGKGPEVCRQLLVVLPETRVVMMTTYAEDGVIADSIEAGASAFLLKTSGEVLALAIEAVSRGEVLFHPDSLLGHSRHGFGVPGKEQTQFR